MSGIIEGAANLLGEVADYLHTEAENLKKPASEQHGQGGDVRPLGSSTEPSGTRLQHSGPHFGAHKQQQQQPAASDGSTDSLYGPAGLNATAPDISRERLEGGEEAPREDEGGLGDTLRNIQQMVAEETERLKSSFSEGSRDSRDHVTTAEDPRQQQQEQGLQQAPLDLNLGGGEGREAGSGGPEEPSLQETLTSAKERIDEETRLLKQHFSEGYRKQTGEGGEAPGQ